MGHSLLSTEELDLLDTKGAAALSTDALERLDRDDDAAEPAVGIPSADTAGAFGRLNETIASKAVDLAKPVAAPIDATIKKADAVVGEQFPKETQEAVALTAGKVAASAADFASEQLGLPDVAVRHTKDVVAGAIGLGSGVGGALRAVGFENLGNVIAKSSQETAKNLMPPDPNITDAVAQGLGSMAAFMIPGIGVTSSAGAVAVVAPRLGVFLGVATSSILEAGTEAGEVYNSVMEKTNDPVQANVAAGQTFAANIPFIHYTNKLGWAGDQSTRAARAIESFFTEGAQEGGQQLISNFASNDPIMADVFKSAFVGGIVGGVAGGAVHGIPPAVPGEIAPPDSPPGSPPGGPAAPVQADPEATAPAPAPVAQEQAIPTPEQLVSGSDAPALVPLNTAPIMEQPGATPAPVELHTEPIAPAAAPESEATNTRINPAEAPKAAEGMVLLESGREIPLPPAVKGTPQGIKKQDAWLVATAMSDATEAKNEYAETLFKGMDPKKLSPADRDTLNDYLFGSADGINVKTGERIGARMSGAREDAMAAEPIEPTESNPEAVQSAVEQLEKAGYEPKVARTLATVFEGFRVLGERAGIDPQALFDRYGVKMLKGNSEEALPAKAENESKVSGVVYHGSPSKKLNGGRLEIGTKGLPVDGIYFSREEKGAGIYAKKGSVHAASVSILNPANDAIVDEVRKGRNGAEARAELIRLGYDGVISEKRGDIIAFNPEQVDLVTGDSAKTAAKLPGDMKTPTRHFNTEMLEGANLSEFLGETSNLYLEILGDLAEAQGSSKNIRADYKTLLEWFGVKSRQEIQASHREQLSRGFEAYLMEGKAPSSRLQEAFNTFKGWLTAIYKSATALEVDLTPEVRRVFDRILASDADLKTAVDSAEKAVAKARKRKSEADSQAPPEIPQDIAAAAQGGVERAQAQLKKASEKAEPVAKQKAPKASDKAPMILGVKRKVLEAFIEKGWVGGDARARTAILSPLEIEKYVNAGLLNANGFTPTDLAPKAVAELERVKAIMAKGYIDDTSLVQPAKLTVKSILKNMAGGRSGPRPALFAAIPSGWIVDGRIMFRIRSEDESSVNLYKHLGEGHTAPNLEQVIPQNANDLVTGILGASEGNDGGVTYLLGTQSGRQVLINASFYDFFKSRYPDMKAMIESHTGPIRVEEYSELVGVMMPMRHETPAKFFSAETGEEIIKTVPKGRAEIDAKTAEAEQLRGAIRTSELVTKADEKEIARLDKTPGEKSSALIVKIATLQNENVAREKQRADWRSQVAILEEQAASLREAHGITDLPASGLVKRRPKGGKGGSRGASSGGFAEDTPVELGGMEHIKPFRMPELVRLAYELMGRAPEVASMSADKNGYFKASGLGAEIKLNPEIFKKPDQAAKTLAHEIGHLIDYLPDNTLKRGNLLGSLRSLHSHLANQYGVLQVTNKGLRDELMAVTMYWRPYDPEASTASYNSYRKSARELYADAISVLFNTPGTLERMAPNFYREFFAGLDTKPDVKLQFFALQEFLHSPEIKIQESRYLDRKAMYLTAEDLWKQKRAAQEIRDNRYGEWVKQLIWDKNQKIIGEVEAAASKGQPLPPSQDPRYILEEMSLADNNNHAFLEEIETKVASHLRNEEISHLDMGDYLYLSRVAQGDRQAFANPKGYNPEEANKALDFMRIRLGLEKFGKLEEIASNFREIVFQLSKQAMEVGAYNKEVFTEKIEANRGSYAVFAVQEHLEDYITAGVKEQIGTLKDIANPFTATVMKMIALNRMIAKQKGANAVRDFLIPRGEATKAEVVAKGDKLTKFREKKGFGLLELLEDGKPTAYYVDPYIAEAFQRKPAGTFELGIKVLDSVFNGIFRPLYITFNIGFQLFSNPVRDFQRVKRNVYALVKNDGYVGTVKSILVNYARGLGSAGRRAAGIHDDLISEMIANKSLDITLTDYSFDPDADQYTSVLRKMGLGPIKDNSGILDRAAKYKLLKPIVATLEGIRFIGNTFETISKVAGYNVLKADSLKTLDKAIAAEKDPQAKKDLQAERVKLSRGEGEYAHALAYNTRNYVGTPNWRRKGTITRISNTIFPFSNIMIQGLRSDYEIATRPNTRTGFMLDMTITQVLPKLLMLMAAAGGAGDDLEEFFRKVSEYDKSNFIVIPIGFEYSDDGKRKAVYARIPHDESGRIIAAVFWKMANAMRGDPKAFNQIIDFGAGQIPSMSPPINIASNWIAYLSGKNPYDSFRGRPLMSDRVYRAGGRHALKKMVQWTANSMGLSGFATHDDSNKSKAESALEIVPVFNRVFRISDYGEREEDMKKLSEKQSEDAARQLDRGASAKSYTLERYILTQKKAMDEISGDERVRLAKLNKYYPLYLSYGSAIKRANEKGDADGVQKYTDRLEAALSKVVE